jgi:RNA polymerase sigma factor (sigma-70 family)
MNDDVILLRRYTEEGSESAFAELVRRHVDLVYSAALRRTGGDTHRAADIAQEVFAKLARSAAKLSHHPALGAWLHTATRNAAINLLRSEQRRQHREQEAQMMQGLSLDAGADASWNELQPVIDAAIDHLNDADRTAVVLRFFEKRPFSEIGEILHVTENTARMRTDRALLKLRARLARRGFTSSAAALAMTLTAQAATAAPAELAAAVTGVSLGGATGVAGSMLLQFFLTMNKLKVGVACGVLLAGTVTALELRANQALSTEIASLQASNQLGETEFKGLPGQSPGSDELIRLRNRIAQLRARPDGVLDSEMKPRAEWRNVGRATPETALETIMWAASVRNLDTMADSIVYSDANQQILDRWFATLSDAARTKFGTAERLLAPITAGTMWPVKAFQVLGGEYHDDSEHVTLTYWESLTSGKERQSEVHMVETTTADGAVTWRVANVGRDMTESDWQKMVFSHIDPATGEPIPRAP